MTDRSSENLFYLSKPFVVWALGSAAFFVALTLAIIGLEKQSESAAAKALNSDFRNLLPFIAYGYFFGFVGAALRLATDYQRADEAERSGRAVYFSTKVKLARLLTGSVFGMLSFLILDTGLLQSVLLGIDARSIVGSESGEGPVPIKAIMLFGVLAGLFAGETFGKLKSTVDDNSTDQPADADEEDQS